MYARTGLSSEWLLGEGWLSHSSRGPFSEAPIGLQEPRLNPNRHKAGGWPIPSKGHFFAGSMYELKPPSGIGADSTGSWIMGGIRYNSRQYRRNASSAFAVIK